MNWNALIVYGGFAVTIFGGFGIGIMVYAEMADAVADNSRAIAHLQKITSADAIADYQVWRNDVEWKLQLLCYEVKAPAACRP